MTVTKQPKDSRWWHWLPAAVFVLVFAGHALYICHTSQSPIPGWANAGIVDHRLWGFGPYVRAEDYFTGFSYALGSAFAAWAIAHFVRQRRAAMLAAGSVSLVAVLMAGGCFLIGCCGSPMLAVYLAIFGAKALGVGKPLMALVTLLSTGCGYYCLSPRFRKRGSRAGAGACCSGSTSCCTDTVSSRSNITDQAGLRVNTADNPVLKRHPDASAAGKETDDLLGCPPKSVR